ncbi:hypothetical protein D3C72_2535320 [compost metagenome]
MRFLAVATSSSVTPFSTSARMSASSAASSFSMVTPGAGEAPAASEVMSQADGL